MDTAAPLSPPAGRRRWQVPRLDPDRGIIGGVAAGLAAEVGTSPVAVRAALVVLALVGGWGLLLYPLAWAVGVGLAYVGRVPSHPPVPKGRSMEERQLGLALVTAGVAVVQSLLPGLPLAATVPLGLAGVSLVVAWRQIRPDATHRTGGTGGLALAVAALLAGGVATMVASAVLFGTGESLAVYLVVVTVLVGVVATSPWWWRLVQAVDAEREARIRSDERAELAAHLHDSVLQTLLLMQQSQSHADVVRLARTQERELRNWLDPDRVSRLGGSLRGRLDQIVDEIERDYDVRVDVVVVGDVALDEALEAATAATREAIVNAAKHSGVDQISVFAEVGASRVEIFVRDRGSGFDRASVASDRRGIRHSITERLERVGGQAMINSEPGEGTEVELVVPRGAD